MGKLAIPENDLQTKEPSEIMWTLQQKLLAKADQVSTMDSAKIKSQFYADTREYMTMIFAWIAQEKKKTLQEQDAHQATRKALDSEREALMATEEALKAEQEAHKDTKEALQTDRNSR